MLRQTDHVHVEIENPTNVVFSRVHLEKLHKPLFHPSTTKFLILFVKHDPTKQPLKR